MDYKEVAIRYLFLDMAMILIKKDIQNIENGPFKIKEPYISLLEQMHTVATDERRKLKKIMYDNKVSVHKLGSENGYTTYKFIHDGIHKQYNYNNQVIKLNVEK